MSQYRKVLYSGVASAVLVIAASGASAQTVIDQSSVNNANVSNPATGTNTIVLGTGGLGTSLGIGSSVSSSATGAVTSTSVIGINSDFSNPAGGFGTVTQTPFNSGAILNAGSITSVSAGTAASGSSLSVGAAGSVASFSILGVGAADFTAVPVVGDIKQGGLGPPQTGLDVGSVNNTGGVTAPVLVLSGTGASASVSAVGSQGVVSVGALGATSFSATTFGTISQTIATNSGVPSVIVSNTSSGVWVGNLSGTGASVSVAATGAAASVLFNYLDTTAWSASSVDLISQFVTNNAGVINFATANNGIQVGNLSGVGASVGASATGSIAALSMSSALSGGSGTPVWATALGGVIQNSTNNAPVSNTALMTSGGLTGVGSSAAITATGAGATVSVASLSDTSNPALLVGTIGQMVTHTGGPIGNQGFLTVGGALAAGASASVSAVGAQGAVSVSSINGDSFSTPNFNSISQVITNGPAGVGSGGNVTNTLLAPGVTPGLSVGNLSGSGASVSVAATGAAASVSYSFVNTTAWSATLVNGITQSVGNAGLASNDASVGISVGDISGRGASVRASATGSIAAISLTSINSGPPATVTGPPVVGGYGLGPIMQSSINVAPVMNTASIVSSGTVTGIGSSVAINATGAAASFSAASIADSAAPALTVVPTITQGVTNSGPLVSNVGSITLGPGTMGAGSAVAISAVGASAAVSFVAIK